MWTRRLKRTLAAISVALLFPAAASANCVGADLIPQIRAEDPAAVDAMFARAAEVPNGQGRFWKVARDGVDDSYLLGSFHAAEAIETLTDEMWSAYDATGLLVVEVDLDQQAAMEARMATDPAFSFDLGGPGISARLTAEQQQHLDQALGARGMRLADVDLMQPWLLASLLSFPACHLQSMARGEQPMDVLLAERALNQGREVRGLESYEDAIDAFRRVDPNVLIESIASTGEMADQEEDLFRTNMDLYTRGDIAVIPELGIVLGERVSPDIDHRALSEQVLTEILDTRNQAWMVPLKDALKPGGTFVVVGALHLPGKLGLVELLRAEGYTVTRLDL